MSSKIYDLDDLVWITFFALAKAAGTADRRLEEIKRLSAEREAGVVRSKGAGSTKTEILFDDRKKEKHVV